VNLCRNSTDPLVGLGLYEDNDSFKCYMADTGLLVSQAFADRETTPDDVYRDILFDKLSLNEGMLVEMRWLSNSGLMGANCISSRAWIGRMPRKPWK